MSQKRTQMMRNAAWLMLQRAGLVVSGILYAALIPRIMGKEMFGRFALLTSLSAWFMNMSEFGFTQIMSRYVPARLIEEGTHGVKRLFGNLFILRVAGSAIFAVGYVIVTRALVQDVSLPTIVLFGCATFVWAISNSMYTLQLGLNSAARWGVSPTIRRWSYPILIATGWYTGGMFGAVIGVLLSEFFVIALGTYWTSDYFSRDMWRIDFKAIWPMLQFGLVFFIAGLLHATFRQSGDTLIRLITDNYAEVGYYGLAFAAYIAGAAAVMQLLQSFVPFLSDLIIREQREELRTWLERIMRTMTIATIPVLFGALFIGNHVAPLVFGQDFAPVGTLLIPMAIIILSVTSGGSAHLVSVVFEKPRFALQTAALRWGAFWAIGIPLIHWHGSLGAAIAAAIASVAAAAFFTIRVQTLFAFPLKKWAAAVGLGVLFVPLVFLKSSAVFDLALFVFATVSYAGLLFFFRILTVSELRAARDAISAKGVDPMPQ